MKKSLACLVAACGALVLSLAAGSAGASKTAAVNDGFYATPLNLEGSVATVNLSAIDNGTKLASGRKSGVPATPGVKCENTPALKAAGFTETSSILWVYVPTGVHLTIKNRSFSYTGPAYVSTEYIGSGHPDPGTISFHGRFKSGKILPDKTIAVTGTVSSSLCGKSIPRSFSAIWAQ
jgi:hypothetical protein